MNVSAIIVTRGDVDLEQVLAPLPQEWERVIWDNGARRLSRYGPGYSLDLHEVDDLSVYGRYAAIAHATGELIYVQDDDCVVSDPQAIVRSWITSRRECQEDSWDPQMLWRGTPNRGDIAGISFGQHVACNMPANFRHAFYQEHALVGFGAVFRRDAPQRVFQRWGAATMKRGGALEGKTTFHEHGRWSPFFLRACDIVFTALTPRVLVDVPYDDLPWASAENRMWKQPTHREERGKMLELVLKVRNGR